MIYNLEYRILDRLGRTKTTKHAGVFLEESKLEAAKQSIIKQNAKRKLAFDVYLIEEPLFKFN